ncbi:hypothetical protein [Tsuneonella sp. HG222]
MKRFIAPVMLLLSACQQGEQPAPQPSVSPEPPQPVASLVGDYEVVDVDERGFAPTNAVILHIDDARIDFANCQRIGWAYTLDDGKLETERAPPPGEPCPDKLDVRVLQMVSAVDALEKAERLPDGRIKLTGALRSVTLASD